MSQIRFGTRLVNRLSAQSLEELQGWLEDYDYVRQQDHYAITEAKSLIKVVERVRRRRERGQ
jgi:hypothetical protein